MQRGLRFWQMAGLAAWSCCCTAAIASGQTLGPAASPFASCERIADARRLDDLQRDGVAAIICTIAPELQFAVLFDDIMSWPNIKDGSQPWVSLRDPVATRIWLPNFSPLMVRFDQDSFLVVRTAGGQLRAVYSAGASRTDAPGNINALVAVQIRPPCLLGVTRDAEEALRLAREPSSPCIPPWRR
jgi:hypothetical protein